MTNQEQRFNEVTALADRMVELIHALSRHMTRQIEDLEDRREIADNILEEYDRLMAKWSDEDEDE